MILKPDTIDLKDPLVISLLGRLQDIFDAMDREYARAAVQYQFQCDGCQDNCCLTRFYHHTYLEYFYLRGVFEKLELRQKNAIIARAEAVCRKTAQADKKALPVRLMCPLNDDGRCRLYPFRPMICRMHGIPHELQKPGQKIIHGPGCHTFEERCAGKDYVKFDRTPFYVAMAKLENEFKQAAGLKGKIKMTVAEMITSIMQKNINKD
jgi:Fe-S-cluster containining protein